MRATYVKLRTVSFTLQLSVIICTASGVETTSVQRLYVYRKYLFLFNGHKLRHCPRVTRERPRPCAQVRREARARRMPGAEPTGAWGHTKNNPNPLQGRLVNDDATRDCTVLLKINSHYINIYI